MNKYKKIVLSSLIVISSCAFAEENLIGVQPYSSGDNSWLHEKIQNEHAQALLTIQHNAGFVGYYKLQYFTKSSQAGVWDHKFFKTNDLTVGLVRQFKIPSDASEIIFSGFYYTGLIWAPERALFSQELNITGQPSETVKITAAVWGTIFSPKYSITYN